MSQIAYRASEYLKKFSDIVSRSFKESNFRFGEEMVKLDQEFIREIVADDKELFQEIFEESEEFEALKKRRLVMCPNCGTIHGTEIKGMTWKKFRVFLDSYGFKLKYHEDHHIVHPYKDADQVVVMGIHNPVTKINIKAEGKTDEEAMTKILQEYFYFKKGKEE